ncbi:YheC/YheD family endospore coat-associated protein [Aneurinibacillus aneurinilyticus]|uniref:YheC/YheD family endospore coat-associated protein n=1 Tax=Aneurinibacillus aneurinilyticus TaxID=1391 RepID=UPI002E1D7FDA|nr:YheC/YheD family protein [Aneurinibacillus aneurinilyticus]
MKKKATGYLGILATPSTKYLPFPDKTFYAYLTQAGRRIGLPVYVILPTHINFATQSVIAYRYTTEKKWVKTRMPFPTLIYDRLSNRKKYETQIKKLKSQPSITFLGHVLGDKLKNHNHLIQHPGIAAHMPPTEPVTSMQVIKNMLNVYDAVIVKPMRNSLGIGVMKVTSKNNIHRVDGRDFKNKVFHRKFSNRSSLLFWLQNQCKVKMIAQPYLELHTPEGVPFDIRVLVQKGGNGEWGETGRAVRAGAIDGLTSNLCGGGKAHTYEPFLRQYFSEEQLLQIHREIDFIVKELPPFLESRHGRLVELGIDIGIDLSGRVWLIEVNSKPGRASFRKIENGKYRRDVQLNPLRYAYYLVQNRKGTATP